jgi:hypothetical protein
MNRPKQLVMVELDRAPEDPFTSKEYGLFCFLIQTESPSINLRGALRHAHQITHDSDSDTDTRAKASLTDTVGESFSFDALDSILDKKKGELSVIYDCPISVTISDFDSLKSELVDDAPMLEVKRLPKSWGVHIERGEHARHTFMPALYTADHPYRAAGNEIEISINVAPRSL